MEKFTASNGRIVSRDALRLYVDRGEDRGLSLSDGDEDALREFFLHERDQELGRWRWPDNPDYVVYRDDRPGGFRVMHEPTGDTWTYFWDAIKDDPQYVGPWNAARAYFAAHPEPKPEPKPKPWEAAKKGEIWLFKGKGLRDEPTPFTRTGTGTWRNPAGRELPASYEYPYHESHDPDFEPRRIWPEQYLTSNE